MDKSQGFSLISTLIALSLMGFTVLALTSMKVVQEKELKAAKQSLASASLKSLAIQVIADKTTCSCHFDSSINTIASSLTLDTSSLENIGIGSLRAGCDFSRSDNIIAKSNQEIPNGGGLKVKNVKIFDIVETGITNLYQGRLVIQYKPTSQVRALQPIVLPLTFAIDSTAGGTTSRPITSCWSEDSSTPSVGSEDVDCLDVDGDELSDKKKTIAGCQTTDIDRGERVALGFRAGLRSRSTNDSNTFLGYKTGERGSNRQEGCVFLGDHAGKRESYDPDFYIEGYNTAVGYMAAPNAGEKCVMVGVETGFSLRSDEDSVNTFIGNNVGQYAQPYGELMVGSQAGIRALPYGGAFSTTIGYAAGQHNAADNILIGSKAAQKLTDTTHTANPKSEQNLLIGYATGGLSTKGKNNIMIGGSAGGTKTSTTQATRGADNLFIGTEAARESTGSCNVFLGYQSGDGNGSGNHNVFIGHGAGGLQPSGEFNTYLGVDAGGSTMTESFNTFIGWQAGHINQRTYNTMLGAQVGKLNNGSNNIFIGYGAGGNSRSSTLNGVFAVGIDTLPVWLMGHMNSTGMLYVNFRPVATASSRAFKKNIQPVENFKKYLKDILDTPLFTYQYKNKKDYPQKKRMGIISEELPQHLQLIKKGQLSYPDWPTIYGSFWASLKALHQMLKDLKKDLLSHIKHLQSSFSTIKNKQKNLIKQLDQIKKDQHLTKTKLLESYQKTKTVKKNILTAKAQLQKEWEDLISQLPHPKMATNNNEGL